MNIDYDQIRRREEKITEILEGFFPCCLVGFILDYQARHTCTVLCFNDFVYYGPAFNQIWEDHKGRLWIDNDEYGSRVRFCPLCGAEASNNDEDDI